MRTKGIRHIGITVNDFAKSVQWYQEVFGFSLISTGGLTKERMAEMKKLYQLPEGSSVKFGFLIGPRGVLLELFEFSQTLAPNLCWNRPGTHHFCFDVKNINKWYKFLSQREDVEILNEIQEDDGAKWFFIKDPDGNLMELMDLGIVDLPLRFFPRIIGFIMKKLKFNSYYKK